MLITPIDQEALEGSIEKYEMLFEQSHERHMAVYGDSPATLPSDDHIDDGLAFFIEANEELCALRWVLGEAALHGGLVEVDDQTVGYITRAHKFFAEGLA